MKFQKLDEVFADMEKASIEEKKLLNTMFEEWKVEEMKIEVGQVELKLTTFEHKVSVHVAKLSVIKSSRNRFIGDFDTLKQALDYANQHGIEVKNIKSN